ncbi:MAG: glycosyltransferase [Sumerlaeia bacterium]
MSSDQNSQPATNPAILAFAAGTWRWPEVYGSTRYHLWNLAGRGWPVVYVEPPVRFHALGSTWTAPDRPFQVVTPARVTPFGVRMVKSRGLGENLRGLAGRELAKRGLRAANSLKWKPQVYWFGAPWHMAILEHLPKDVVSVCHVYDELAVSPAFNELQKSLLWAWERELLRSCAVAFCSSQPQFDRREDISPRPFLLENCVPDYYLYEPSRPYPIDPQTKNYLDRIKAIPGPRFVYGGVVDHRLDPDILRALIEYLPVGDLVFLGKKDPSFDAVFDREVAQNPRVHFLGDVPHHCYPALYREADVLLIPHKRNDFTNAMYPEKLNEYLASGRPIVSTNISEVARTVRESVYEGAIRTADSPMEFLSAVSVAMADKHALLEEKRVLMAREHTWSKGVDRIEIELRMALKLAGGIPGGI